MTHPSHPLRALEVALETIDALGLVVRRIAQRDRHLADQLKRAAQSIALNLAEAHGNQYWITLMGTARAHASPRWSKAKPRGGLRGAAPQEESVGAGGWVK